jgi:hypothetical protein
MNTSFKPGQILVDINGNRVQAHGGSIFYDDKNDIYYFYGENKEFTKPGSKLWTYGVRCYSSKDLYNWEDNGLIIKPDLEDENSSLNPYTAMLDRPHIIYNKKNDNYVCWCKIMRKDGSQTQLVLTANSILGPYIIVKDRLKPFGFYGGDFDLYIDSETNKAYYLFEKVHTETIIAELNDDYTDVSEVYSSHFPHSGPPYVREATAHFIYNKKHFLITSGTTGYFPNPSEVAVSENIHGPYKVLGDPAPDDKSQITYHSQISSVFKVPNKKNLYIALGDRWCPKTIDYPYPFYRDFFEAIFLGKYKSIRLGFHFIKLAIKYKVNLFKFNPFTDIGSNTSIADYMWFPLRIIDPCEEYPDGMIFIDYFDEWKLEDYE